MKKILLILPLLVLLQNVSFAKELTDKELIQRLIKEVQELRGEVSSLKKGQQQNTQKLKDEVSSLKKGQQENTQEIEATLDLAENIEAKTFQDKINFGVGFKTSLDNFSKTYADGRKVTNNNIWSNKLMLNMKADITENMNFYGRLSMYKYWGSSNIHLYTYYDNMQGRVPSDSAIYVERAYLNYWFFDKNSYIPTSVTLGRQPSSDGPSNQFKDNTTRKGTYSALLYDGAADGVVITSDISKLINNPQSYLRIGYAKGFGYSESSSNVGNAFIGASNNDIKDTNVFGVFFDTTVPNLENSLIQLSYSKMIDIVANPLDTNSSQNKNIGDVDIYGAMIQASNIKNSHLDMFLQYGHSIAYPNTNQYSNYGGLLSANGDTSNKSGDSIWIGTRYGFGQKQKYKIGLEYNHGSKNWINLTQGSFDIYNKLSTRGDAYETYLMYVINRYANIRLGYIYIDYDYSGSGWFIGASQKIDNNMQNADSTVKKLQSIYLKILFTPTIYPVLKYN